MKHTVLLFLLAVCLTSYGQDRGFRSEGREFYLGYLHPSFNNVAPGRTLALYRAYALVSSRVGNEIHVSYFDTVSKQEEFPTAYKIDKGQTVLIPLKWARMIATDSGDKAEYISCHITAKRPVTVHYYTTGANAGGAYLALPVSSWGREYTVASYADNGSGAGAWLGGLGPDSLDLARGYFTIIAAYNDTKVTITPTAKTAGGHVGVNQGPGATGRPVPYTVNLNRGQCYTVKSWSADIEGDDDLSASIVKADKPVAVIAGHENANVGDGSVGGRNLEARDYMIEQMIPFEFWESTGYITIPMMDSPSNNGDGLGEDLRIFVMDKDVPTTVHIDRGTQFDVQPGTFMPPAEVTNTITPAHLSAAAGNRFMVVQYDLRNHGSGAPFPAPSMMSIIPRSNWSTAYQCYVPTNINEKLQGYFITIIALKDGATYNGLTRNWYSDSIIISMNNAPTNQVVSKLGSMRKQWNSIPGHPDLKAVVYQVSPGTSYSIRAPFPFMAYHAGHRAIDADGDLGDFDNDDNFFEYTLPLGASLADRTVPNKIGISVDTLCNGWKICVGDGNTNGGIRFVSLLDDPEARLFPSKPRQYANCSILPPNDALRLGEFHLPGNDKLYCFTVNIDNPGASASAPIIIYDRAGNYKLLELNRTGQQVGITPLVFDSAYTFAPPKVGQKSCRHFTFTNFQTNQQTYTINALKTFTPNFTISSIAPALPAVIAPGDTLGFTVCFEADDAVLHRDTVVFDASCLGFRLPLAAANATAAVIAGDVHYGDVPTNTTMCKTIEVRNAGNVSFTISGVKFTPNSGKFFLDSASAALFPRQVQPGTILTVTVCYRTDIEGPDSVQLEWINDIQPPFAAEHKPTSTLTARGIKSGIEWDRLTERMFAEPDKEVFSRIYLKNIGINTATIDKITLTAQVTQEFRLDGIEGSTLTPPYTGYTIAAGDSAWVQVAFKPDGSRPVTAVRKAEIHATAVSNPSEIRFVNLEGRVITSGVEERTGSRIQISPNPANDQVEIGIHLKSATVISVYVYDLLGREVYQQQNVGVPSGVSTLTLNLGSHPRGAYTVVVRIGDTLESHRLVLE